MESQVKVKVSRKNKQKARDSIEDGIPEIPRISDFQVTDNIEVSDAKNETADSAACDLACEVEQINLREKENEEEKEVERIESAVTSDMEKQSFSFVEPQEEVENSILENAECSYSCQNEETNDLINIQKSSSENENVISDLPSDISSSKSGEDSSAKIVDYYDLQNELKTFVEEIKEPSAPTVNVNTAELSVPSKAVTENVGSDVEKLLDVRNFNFTIILEDLLLPYNDEKLSEYYYNPELQESKTYVNEFINQEVKIETKKDNELYRLLVEYMQVKNRLKVSSAKIKDLKENISTCISTMWTVCNEVKASGKEKCSDGNVITFVQNYTQAHFNSEIFKDFAALFLKIKNEVYEEYSMDSFACSLLRLKIEYYLQSLLKSCPEFTNLEEESSVKLSSVSINSHFQECLLNLKIGISTLFAFQRKQSLDIDSSFLEETRNWLSDLVAVLLRVGSWRDHIFLLHHIMRCPGGVSEWATQYVQLPLSETCTDPFKNPELNHMITIMSILLSPIEQRENFIKKWESELTNGVNQWTVIDSDGEAEDDEQQSCPLKENDLVSLLNQIPFSALFKALLKRDGIQIITSYGTHDYMLKLFSFLTNFVKILLSGLKLYSTNKYKQFTKRLGRLIYHIVQYATDALTVVESQISESDRGRIQVEYDNFFLRSARFICSTKKHGTWQFLATMPYHVPTSNTILKLYGILQLNDCDDDNTVKVDFAKFSEKFSELPEEEQFYLLTTLCSMALARDIVEMEFIKNVLLQLMFIGFLNPATMDHCYKNVRPLLCSICSAHSFLMSEILYTQQNTFLLDPAFDQKLTLNLWSKLPVEIWQPNKRDLEILSVWLLEPVNYVKNELARLILQSLNYGMGQGQLFIPVEQQSAIALMILQANAKLISEAEPGVIKNVSNLVLYQNPDQALHDWTWNVLLKLRLHLLDKSDAEMCRSFYSLADHLRNIPDVESNIDLHHLVLKKQPPACYIALMTTTLGHSVPLICEKGFQLVEILFNAGKYEPGLSCLEHMMLLFLDCSDSLHKCEKFVTLLSRLIAADNSYVQFAKNLISNNFPGVILKNLESMMQHQLNRWRGLHFTYFSSVIKLWLLSLTRLPLWTQEPGVLYLIDKLLENSLFDGASVKMVTTVLKDLLEAQSPPSETKSFSSLVGWMNSKYTPPSLLPKGVNGEVPWYSYQIIHMEFEMNEKNTSLWLELLKELYSSTEKKINVDNCLKKVCNQLKIPVRSSSVLAIYKWSYQILETDFTHPVVPLMWQRFFSLYFYRVPGLTDRGSVGEKFFDGVINQGLFKRLKERLQDTCDYLKSFSENSEEDKGREHYLKCYYLFQTFSVWFHDPNLHRPCLSLHMLPIQYNPELLGLLIHGSETPWIEYLEYQNIEQNFKNVGWNWTKLKNRTGNRTPHGVTSHKKEKSPTERLNERLDSYENPLPPPRIDLKKYSFPRVNLDTMIHAKKMNLFVEPLVQVLLGYMKQYTSGINEYVSLSCDMQELLPHMYVTSEGQVFFKGHCNGVNKVVNGKNVLYSCSGPAMIKLTYQESKLNEKVKQHFGHCWKAFEDNLRKALDGLPHDVTSSAVLIGIAVEALKYEYRKCSNRKDEGKIVSDLKETGVALFDFLVRVWCERIDHVPSLEGAFEKYVEVLAKEFIEGNEEANGRLLQSMLADDRFGDKVCKYFTPNSFSTYDFIENFSKALYFLSEKRCIILSKFDLKQWLFERKPKFSDRSRLITTVGKGIKSLGASPEDQELLKLLNQNLEVLLLYDFPEHYGEVLNFLLEASEAQSIPSSTWFTFLKALAAGHCTFAEGRTDKNVFEPGQTLKKLKHYFSKFATEQNLLSFEIIKGTMKLLASTFKEQRLKLGTRGLYRKYHTYVEPIFIFFGMLSYSFMTKALEIDTGSLSDKLAQHLWPTLSDLYTPWLVPYWMETRKEQTVQGIQEQEPLVALPWILNDSCYASFCASVFVESIRFLSDALPGLNHVLSYTWYFYVANFAHIYVKDYILGVIHEHLLSIPWETFFPSLQDVELMLKVVDQFLPLSHSFLGSIFVNIRWTDVVHYFLSAYDTETTTKLHICLLHLLVKLPLEPSLKQSEKVITLLTEAKGYAWHLVDSCSYEAVLNWFIMSCDPRIILMDERLEYYTLDSTILRLLQVCAGYVPYVKLFHSTTLSKRLIFVRTCVKWMITSNRRFKSKESPLFKAAFTTMLNDMEAVLNETVPLPQRVEEAGALLAEVLNLFLEPDLCPVVEGTLSALLTTRRSDIIVFGLLRAAGFTVENPYVFGSITESALESYFSFTENCNWNEVANILNVDSRPDSEGRLEKVLIDNGHYLTLYGVLSKRYSTRGSLNSKIVLTDLLQLLSEVKLRTTLEPKLILLVIFGLKLVENEIKSDAKEGISYLVKFFAQLNNFTNEKGNGFLSAIGLKKTSSSNRFKLSCLVACSGIVVFIKTCYPEASRESIDEKVLQTLDAAESNKVYQNIQQYISYARVVVKDTSSVDQIITLLKHIGFKLFNKLYLK